MSSKINRILRIPPKPKPKPIPKNILKSKEQLLKESATFTKQLETQRLSQKQYDPVKLRMQQRYFLQQEIIKRMGLNPTEKRILLEYSELDRKLGEMYSQSLKKTNTSRDATIVTLNQLNFLLSGLSKEAIKAAGINKAKLQLEIREITNKQLNSPKGEVVPTELISKIKKALIAFTNQRIGYDIHNEIVEICRKIGHP